MRFFVNIILVLVTALLLSAYTSQKKETPKVKTKAAGAQLSFKQDVVPVFKKYCLPCHTEDQMNPSELYLDSYVHMMKGGKNGPSVVAGKADSSLLVQKISLKPPFGDPMPMKRKTPFPQDTLNILKTWINQGAKNN